jgi:hypothetical protein
MHDHNRNGTIDFVMLKDGCVYFEGHVGELRRTSDSYLRLSYPIGSRH